MTNVTTNEVQVFKYLGDNMEHCVRCVLGDDGEPRFVAADVCKALELEQVTRAVSGLDSDEVTTSKVTDSMGRQQEMLVVTEYGLYSLIMRSRKQEAKTFKRWVTHDVLPSIRKRGVYMTPAAKKKMYERFYIPYTLPDALALASKLEAERAALAAKVEHDAPKLATFDAHYPDGKYTSITDFARTLDGVNSMSIKKSLKNNGYFYQSDSGRYRPYAQFRGIDNMFVEKHSDMYDQYQIFVTNKGMQLITKLYNEGKLIMLKRFAA
jgi:anti-repressor protein